MRDDHSQTSGRTGSLTLPGRDDQPHATAAFDGELPLGACPHVALLLSSRDEVAPALASFYALGAKRNGWLYHRSLAGRAAEDRTSLTAAGLDVAGLEAAGRMVISEMDPAISLHEYVHGWDARMDAALARGFDAVWCSRFPIGPDPATLDASAEFDQAWHEHARDRRYVSLCIFVVGALERSRRAAQLGAFHDHVVTG
jgi:hypothetical protein